MIEQSARNNLITYTKDDFVRYLGDTLRLKAVKCPVCSHDRFGIKADQTTGALKYTMLQDVAIGIDNNKVPQSFPMTQALTAVVMNCEACSNIVLIESSRFFDWMSRQAN